MTWTLPAAMGSVIVGTLLPPDRITFAKSAGWYFPPFVLIRLAFSRWSLWTSGFFFGPLKTGAFRFRRHIPDRDRLGFPH